MLVRQNKGFTLVELLLAVMILAGAISGILLLFTTSMISSEQAWDTTVATSHADHVLEEMQNRESLNDILAVDWYIWAADQRLTTLPDEIIDVTFKDHSSDPIDVEVKVSWVRKSRKNDLVLKTKITK